MKKPDKHAGYFEGILQLRNPNDELVDYVIMRIEKDDRAWIAKVEEVRGGIDIYLSSQKYLRILGKKLTEKFPGIIKTSRKLHTLQKTTSKRLYRVTVLFKLLNFNRGDVLTIQGEEYKILTIDSQVTAKNIKSGKKKKFKLETVEKFAN